jgi:hypothetical protein
VAKICISITAHEHPDVIRNQIENINHFLPNSFIVLHWSFGSFPLRAQIEAICAEFENVFLNSLLTPTVWGWMFHCHLFNYEFAKRKGLPFTHFVLEASAGMLVRHGAEEHIQRFEFLSNHEHARIDDLKTFDRYWGIPIAVHQDIPFLKMLDALGTSDLYFSQHEGMAFERHLFDEMMKIFTEYYPFHLHERRYPREELFFSTVAGNLSKKYSNPITWMGRCPVPAPDPNQNLIAIVESLRTTGTYQYQDARKADPDFGRNYYGFKPVSRNMGDPLRQHITGLFRP